MRREMVRLGLWLVILSSFSLGAPRSRYCGTYLADTIAMVCKDRGYNMAFAQSHGDDPTFEKRFKRGIVDECCRRVCSRTTLEAYCSASSTSRPDIPQIRKRSEHSEKKQLEEKEKRVESRFNSYRYSMNEMGEKAEEDGRWDHNRVFYRPRGSSRGKEKAKRKSEDLGEYGNMGFYPRSNEAVGAEEVMAEVVWSPGFVTTPRTALLRHHRDHSYHNRKISENIEETVGTSQIGTVSPYFQGRTLVLPSSRKGLFSHHF